jgi:hypothetical protein
MSTRSKRVSDEMRGGLEVRSEAESELEELNEEEYERERLENIKYVSLSDHYISIVLSISSRVRMNRKIRIHAAAK